MKIREIHIDGFGIFHNRSLREFSPHLTIILGDNESGKSTLLAFIRRVLFGFPSRRKGGNHYEPLNGGEQGGRIRAATDSGREYEVVRYEKKGKGLLILDEDGAPAGNTIAVIAGGADQAFFENVFAFGLEELESFDTLSDDAVQNHLMSAGAGVTKIPVPDVQRQLDKRIDTCYKKRAQRSHVPEILRELSETEGKLSRISDSQGEFDSLSTEIEEIEIGTERLITEKREMERAVRHNENIIQVWDEWVTIAETEETLSTLEVPESFPDDGVHRLDLAEAEITRAEERLRALTESLKDAISETERITVDDVLFREEGRIRAFEKKLALWEADCASLPEITAEYAASEKACAALIQSIDPRWTSETLLVFDRSLPAQHRVLQYRKRLDELDEKNLNLRKELQQQQSLMSSENEAIERCADEMAGEISALSEEELQAQEHALVECMANLPDLDQKKRALASLQEESAKRAEVFREQAALARIRIPAWPGLLMAGAGVTGLGIGYLTESLILGALFCAALGIAALVYLKTARAASHTGPETTGEDTDFAGISQLIHERTEEIATLETAIRRLAEECGLRGIPSVQSVSERRIELLEIRRDFGKYTALRDEIARRRQTISGLENKISALMETISAEDAREAQISAEWQKWLTGAGLDPALNPASVEKIFTQAERAAEKYREMQALARKRTELISSVEEFCKEVTEVIHICGMALGGSPATDVQALTDALEKQKELRSAQESYRKETERIRRDIRLEEENITGKKAEIRDLLANGHAETRDEFLKYAAAKATQKECMRRREEAEHRLRIAAGSPGAYAAFLDGLRRTDMHALTDTNVELSSEIAHTEEEISHLQQRHGEVAHRLRGMENEDEAALLLMKNATLTEELNDAAREWAKLVIARILLKKGIEKYEKERQPAVFREAEQYFRAVTGGRYVRVIRQMGSDRICVEGGDGNRISAAVLSRGTAEQLYLSLRFGYITEYGRHDESLPAVFDDILVNFDPERRQRSCEAIAKLSEINQVIFFTCHPDTAQMLQDARPDARLIEL